MLQRRWRDLRAVSAVVLYLVCAARAGAQSPNDVSQEKSFQNGFDLATLAALPLGENVYALLETTQSEVIADRFSSGGLNVGGMARVGGFLGSWSQTRYRIGDIDVTDPRGGGGLLLFPELMPWQRVSIGTGLFSPDTIAPGLAVDLEPARPSAHWTTVVNGSGSGGAIASRAPAAAPYPISRLLSWGHGAVSISGPLSPRVGLLAGGSWTRASTRVREIIREDRADDQSTLGSGFAHLVYTRSPTVEGRLFGWMQRSSSPFEYRLQPDASPTTDRSAHLQATWAQHSTAGVNWRIVAGYTQRSRATNLRASAGTLRTVDRLSEGPVPAFVAAATDDTTRRWSLLARLTPGTPVSSKHALAYGLDAEGASVRLSDPFSGVIAETLSGAVARVWTIANPGLESQRHRTTLAAFANDHVTLGPNLSLDASLRVESVGAEARDAANGVRWNSLLPRAAVRWKVTELAQLSLIGGYQRAANQLNLDLLAYGDPAAPFGTVSRTDVTGPNAAPVVIDRIGPGTGGDPAFSRIDPDLRRPYTNELVLGLESDREGWIKWGLMGIGRIESHLIGLTDIGVPSSAYSAGTQFDPGQVADAPFDDQQLAVYNRLPSTFGKNQYLLTNPEVEAARSFALKLTAQAIGRRFSSLWVATASLAQGSSGNRGFGPLENDQDVIGELFTNPNAAGFARGRLFADRAFTIKWTTVYKFPGDFDLGAIARYQDGQPLSRLVIASGLNQGPEILLAYPNASHRFTFTGTLDLRVRKGIAFGTNRAELILDAYNLFTRSNEVEEFVVTGPDFRRPTAIEPPPSVHVGLRLTF